MDVNRHAQGLEYEELALAYLEELGYRLYKRNFKFGKAGEIDLIMLDGDTWVFVEVKGRRSHVYGTPEDAVDLRKRQQLRRVAQGFVHVTRLTDFSARFDVVAVDYFTGRDGLPEIRHHIDAFR